MGWYRIDHLKIRDTGGGSAADDTSVLRRVYGKEGELWPRLTIAIYKSPVLDELYENATGLVVSHSFKQAPGQWWEGGRTTGIPSQLCEDVCEMLIEAEIATS